MAKQLSLIIPIRRTLPTDLLVHLASATKDFGQRRTMAKGRAGEAFSQQSEAEPLYRQKENYPTAIESPLPRTVAFERDLRSCRTFGSTAGH